MVTGQSNLSPPATLLILSVSPYTQRSRKLEEENLMSQAETG